MDTGSRQSRSHAQARPESSGRQTEPVSVKEPGSLLVSQFREHLPAILADEPVALAYLYGSSVTGQATPLSDIDLALVLGTPLPPRTRLKLILRLRLALHDRCGLDADVRVIDDAPLVFRGRVVSDGLLVFARSEDTRVTFETRTRMRYFDYLPIHRQLQASFFRDVLERGLHGRP